MSEVIDQLYNIGFNKYEAQTYSILLQQNTLSASELTKISGISRGRIYDILNQLMQKGFCTFVAGTVKKYQAVHPEVAMQNLIEIQKKDTALMEQKMIQTGNNLKKFYHTGEDTSSPLDYISVLTSKPSMIKKFHELGNNAKKIVRTFNKGPYAVALELESIKKDSTPIEESLNKGTISKALYEIEKDDQDQFIESLQFYSDLGEEIRVCDHLPMKMLISDNNTVMISLRSNGSSKFKLTSMIVEHSDLTDALIELFDIYWEKSMALDEFIKNMNIKNQEES